MDGKPAKYADYSNLHKLEGLTDVVKQRELIKESETEIPDGTWKKIQEYIVEYRPGLVPGEEPIGGEQ